MFYGGLGCVVTGNPQAQASIHHLDGDPGNSALPNLVPLSLNLHVGLKKNLKGDRLRPELREMNLRETAERHFKSGRTTSAYGCLRLAYALSTHFLRLSDRDLEAEFQLAAHCLYFLRRSMTATRLDIASANLRYILDHELNETLTDKKIVPPFGEFCLLVELASWLSEFGWSDEGLGLLRKARQRLKTYQNKLAPKDVARFQRQLVNALIHVGEYGLETESAMRRAMESGDTSENNRYAIDNARMNYYLMQLKPREALVILKEQYEYFEKETDFCFGTLDNMDKTIQTSLSYMALSLLCESQLIHSPRHRRNLEGRLVALIMQEQHYGVTAMVNRTQRMIMAMDQAEHSFPSMLRFREGRVFPQLPKAEAESILRVAQNL